MTRILICHNATDRLQAAVGDGKLGHLVHRQAKRLDLQISHVISQHHRNFSQAQLLCGLEAQMPIDHGAVRL